MDPENETYLPAHDCYHSVLQANCTESSVQSAFQPGVSQKFSVQVASLLSQRTVCYWSRRLTPVIHLEHPHFTPLDWSVCAPSLSDIIYVSIPSEKLLEFPFFPPNFTYFPISSQRCKLTFFNQKWMYKHSASCQHSNMFCGIALGSIQAAVSSCLLLDGFIHVSFLNVTAKRLEEALVVGVWLNLRVVDTFCCQSPM